MTARNRADLCIQFPEQICEPFLIFFFENVIFREEDQYPPPADIQNHLLGKAGNPSAYIHTGSYGCTFCKKHRQFSNCCHPARCAECFFSYTAAAMHQIRMALFVLLWLIMDIHVATGTCIACAISGTAASRRFHVTG